MRLGLTSFGGPVAHLGYFRRSIVAQRGWMTETQYSALVALCQVLPGPASSQTGFGIGLLRCGWRGGIAAWAGFTLPSALLMFAFAMNAGRLQAWRFGPGLLHGLQIAATAVVAQAVYGMARSLCPDTPRRCLAALSLLLLFLLPGTMGQLLVILLGALIGRAVLATPEPRPARPAAPGLAASAAAMALALFCILLLVAFLPATGGLALFDAFYRSGALVFGGGHVVLPLLHDAVVRPGWVAQPLFLAGYGAAQAMPGPLFCFAAYLGALSSTGPMGPAGAAIALSGIFLPGLLLTLGILPFWHGLRQHPGLAAALNGVNAAVLGLLAFAFIGILTNGAIRTPFDALFAMIALTLLATARLNPVFVVAGCAAAGLLMSAALPLT